MNEIFQRDGLVVVRGAVAPATVAACVAAIADALRAVGTDLDDPSTWTKPVVRVACPEGPAFADAGQSPALLATYDTLLGPGKWARRAGVGGSVPVRFPSEEDPGDAGWHIDSSFEVDGEWRVNHRSRHRALLALFLFSDVGPDDAPTEVLVGSHQDVAAALEPFGEAGVVFGDPAERLPASTFARPRALATGSAGDVWLCHPFLVHRATWPHRGTRPRILAQPAVVPWPLT